MPCRSTQEDNAGAAEVVEGDAAAVAMDSDAAVADAAAASALEPEPEVAADPSPAGKKASGRKGGRGV